MKRVIGTSLQDSSAWLVEDCDEPATKCAVIDADTQSVWAAGETEQEAREQVEKVQWKVFDSLLSFAAIRGEDTK